MLEKPNSRIKKQSRTVWRLLPQYGCHDFSSQRSHRLAQTRGKWICVHLCPPTPIIIIMARSPALKTLLVGENFFLLVKMEIWASTQRINAVLSQHAKRDLCNQILNGILHECRVQLFDICCLWGVCCIFLFYLHFSESSMRIGSDRRARRDHAERKRGVKGDEELIGKQQTLYCHNLSNDNNQAFVFARLFYWNIFLAV